MVETKSKKTQPKKITINHRTIGYVVMLLAWVAVSMIISQFIVGLPMIWILGSKLTQPLWTCVEYGLTYALSLVLVVVVPPKAIETLKRKHKSKLKLPEDLKTSRQELGLEDLPTLIDVGLAPISYIVYIIIANVFAGAMSVFTWFNPQESQNVGFGYFITSLDRIVAMLALVFIAPVAEEIIMRGWLYGKLREKINIPVAMLLVSVLFGVLHGQWNVGVSVFALSLVLCGLREITGTIWSGMLLHMLSNGIAFYIVYIAGF